jgi:pantoate--beta-alanine ligase
VKLSTVSTVPQVRQQLDAIRRGGKTIGLVPTMGALHAGHASLIENARAQCDFVVVSIFVNPLQFGPNEDYQRYPRPLEKDLEVCERVGADLVFVPSREDLYLSEQRIFIEVMHLGDHLCGPFRPGHFRGVATVVAKLFNVIQPHKAYFGEKDYQQLRIIRKMAEDLNFGVEVVSVPIYRDADGLALSSRNVYPRCRGENRSARSVSRLAGSKEDGGRRGKRHSRRERRVHVDSGCRAENTSGVF